MKLNINIDNFDLIKISRVNNKKKRNCTYLIIHKKQQ